MVMYLRGTLSRGSVGGRGSNFEFTMAIATLNYKRASSILRASSLIPQLNISELYIRINCAEASEYLASIHCYCSAKANKHN